MWGQAIFEFYLRQARIVGIRDLFVGALCLIAGICGLVFMKRGYALANSHSDESDSLSYLLLTLYAMATIVVILVGLGFTSDSIPELLNPNYWALKQILSDLSGK